MARNCRVKRFFGNNTSSRLDVASSSQTLSAKKILVKDTIVQIKQCDSSHLRKLVRSLHNQRLSLISVKFTDSQAGTLLKIQALATGTLSREQKGKSTEGVKLSLKE